jgi:hypothetical protein
MLSPLVRWREGRDCSSSSFMFMYFLVPQFVAETCRSRAATSIGADCPSGNAPTTFLRRRASRSNRSIGLFVFSLIQCSGDNGSSSASPRCVDRFQNRRHLAHRAELKASDFAAVYVGL